jgi:TPR repeat protein
MDTAMLSLDEGDHFGALLRYLILAYQGSEPAMSNVAWMLKKGKGCVPSLQQSKAKLLGTTGLY